MRRRLFTFTAAVSAVLFVGVCGLWVRSRGTNDECRIYHYVVSPEGSYPKWYGDVDLSIHSGDGFLAAAFYSNAFSPQATLVGSEGAAGWHWASYHSAPNLAFRAAYREMVRGPLPPLTCGFYSICNNFPASRRSEVGVPIWFIAVITGITPFAYARSHFRRMRTDRRACRACGYDLRASPGRCPECGAVPKPAKGAA